MRPAALTARPQAVLDAVAARPGASVQELADALGVDHSTAEYHLHRLERAGRVRAVRAGRVRAHYASGAPYCPYLRVLLPQFRAAEDLALLRALAAGEARALDLARATGRDVPGVRWLLEKAARAGVVESPRYGAWRVRAACAPCLAHLDAGTRCGQWGTCAISREMTRAPDA